VLLIIASLSTALGGTPPPEPWLLSPESNRHPEYPESTHYCGGGSGSEEEEAKARAIGEVSRQLRSEVSSQIKTSASSELNRRGRKVGGATIAEQRIQVASNFEYAELIRFVGATKHKRVHYAYACLDRSEGVQQLTSRTTADLLRFQATVDQARTAWDSGDVAGFTAAYRAGVVAWEPVAVPSSIISTMAGGKPTDADAASDGIAYLHSTAMKSVSGVRFAIQIDGDGLSSSDTKAIAEHVQGSLADLGFIVGGQCSTGAKGTWGADVAVSLASKYTSFGRYQVTPTIDVSVRNCGRSDAPLTASITDPSLMFNHQDEGKAKAGALAKITRAAIEPTILEMVEPVFPIER